MMPVPSSRRNGGVSGGRGAAGIAVGLAAGVGLLTLAATAYATTYIARVVVTPPTRRRQDQLVLAVDEAEGTITLRDTPDASVAGRYGLWFGRETGFALVGDVVRREIGTVTRTLDEVRFGDIRSARRCRLSGWYYLEPEELGLPVHGVAIATPLGQAPAWHFPADGPEDKWVIQVHGRGARRQEGLRAVHAFREQGYSSLLISYRNDGDAPDSEDRRYGLGGTEWLDVEAAIDFAVDHGAKEIVLMGWSMGGAIVLQTAMRSRSLERVTGIVLESPVIDWIDTLKFQADGLRLPPLISHGAMHIIGSEWGKAVTGQSAAIDFASMDFVARAKDLSLPILILHSDDDGFVPSTGSRALADARPDIVTFEPFTEAKHTKLWNYDEERFNRSIVDWLGALVPRDQATV
jgi:alpha-beta hydrolase superfamily lysophospholipase